MWKKRSWPRSARWVTTRAKGCWRVQVVARPQHRLGLDDPRHLEPVELQQFEHRVGRRDDHHPRQRRPVHQAHRVPE